MPLPLTLLVGLSTSLRDDLLRCTLLRRPGLVAVSYDVDPQPDGVRLVRRVVDAAGTTEVEHIDLVECCLSCTVRQDVPQALELVAASGRWEQALLALPSALQPDAVTHVLDDAGVRLRAVAAVVDAVLLREQITGDDLLADRGLAAAPTDRRSTASLVLGQLEDADLLAVVGLERLGTAEARALQALLSHLAPLAAQVGIGPGGVGAEDVLTGANRLEMSAHQREHLSALAVELCPPDCGVTTLRWYSDRPLHSGRLAAVLPEIVGSVVRSRGHLWLADRPRACIRWESAGPNLGFGDPVRWRTLPGCSLVLTGIDLDATTLRELLDSCLATDDELLGAPDWPDPFADALGPADLEPT